MRDLIGKLESLRGRGSKEAWLWEMGTALKKEMGGLDPASDLTSSFVPMSDSSVSPAPGLGWEVGAL